MAERKSVEVSSEQLYWELVEIKERVGALENVAGIVNAEAIASHIESHLKDKPQRKAILKACEKPKTADQLAEELSFKSRQALDHHLNPLRDEGLIHVRKIGATLSFEQSPLLRKISKRKLAAILG